MKIIDLGINGEGVAKENGKVFFVKNALPGEDVEIEVLKENKKFSFAKATKIKAKSSDRVEPLCPYFGICGGCQLQHMDYEKQLEFKQNLVKSTLKKVGEIEVEVQTTIPSDEIYFYRNKSAFPFGFNENNLYIGMFEENSHNIVSISECKIAKSGINKILQTSKEFFNINKNKNIKYLVIRNINQNYLITLVVRSKNIKLEAYIAKLKELNINFSLNINVNKNDNLIFSNQFQNIFGENILRQEEFGLKVTINSASFLQINDSVKKKLYEFVLSEIEKGEDVVDAYCGAGLLSGIIARKANHVYGVEISKEAIKSANKLCEENGLKNLTFICGDCKDEIPKLLKNVEDNFVLVLDPPRAGCNNLVLQSALDTGPSKVVYISCNPITLAKDLKVLSLKYEIEKVQPFDMFPQTSNVETAVILRKK